MSAPSTGPLVSASVSALANNDEFLVQSASDILGLLQQLQDRQLPITLSRPGSAPLMGRLCSVNGPQAELQFELSDAVNQPPGELASTRPINAVSATAYLDQIRLQFDLDGLAYLTHPATEARRLRCNLPTLLYRFQRRQTFRVRPMLHRPHVLVQHPQHATQSQQASQQRPPLRLRILDLSLGGLALWLPPDVTPFEPGSRLPAVQVELSSDTRFQAAMQLQNSQAGEASGQQLGLSFAQLSAAAERELQLYIEQTQKRARLLRKS